MKVRVAVTVDIDPDAWELEYGVPRSEVREDVKRYIEVTVTEQLAHVGVLKGGQET